MGHYADPPPSTATEADRWGAETSYLTTVTVALEESCS